MTRVAQTVGSTTTVSVTGFGFTLAEYENGVLAHENIQLGSTLLSRHEGGTLTYFLHDHLSVRVLTDASGAIMPSGQQGHYPFGESWYDTTPADPEFTSYSRDDESGLDYAVFRQYSSKFGRFTMADPIAGHVGRPQSWNRYGYVLGDPVNLVDPFGLYTCIVTFKADDGTWMTRVADCQTFAYPKPTVELSDILSNLPPHGGWSGYETRGGGAGASAQGAPEAPSTAKEKCKANARRAWEAGFTALLALLPPGGTAGDESVGSVGLVAGIYGGAYAFAATAAARLGVDRDGTVFYSRGGAWAPGFAAGGSLGGGLFMSSGTAENFAGRSLDVGLGGMLAVPGGPAAALTGSVSSSSVYATGDFTVGFGVAAGAYIDIGGSYGWPLFNVAEVICSTIYE